MSRYKQLLFSAVLIVMPLGSFGQVVARVAGLENNARYMDLLVQEQRLQKQEDSVVNVIATTRKLFASATAAERGQYGQAILKLESDLFEIRNQIGEVGASISSIEQEYVMAHMDVQSVAPSTPAVDTAKKQVPNLVYNDYFKTNLSPTDYQSLCHSQERESLLLPGLISQYIANYHQMETMATEYDTAGRAQAEEAWAKLQTMTGINTALSDSIAHVWNYIYDNKIYAYNYLLDRLNKSELLSKFDGQFRKISQQIASMRDKVASDVVYGYPLNKKLVLDYEMALAEMLGYTQAYDSLAKAVRMVNTLDYAFAPVNPSPRNFIEYGSIEVTTPSKYNSAHPIPENEIFKFGTVYKVQVGNFVRKQPVSIFRNVSPLCYEKTDEGRYIYYAGAFRELSEAQEAVSQLSKIGFRKPTLVVWRDGVFEALGEDAVSSSASSDQAEILYRVEFTDSGEEMNETVKEILSTVAPDKETSRSTVAEGGYVYSIGTFADRESAELVVEKLNAVEGIAAKAVEL